MNKPFQHSAGTQMLLYSKGSETPVYCRVCPELFLPPYHKKGMFPRLQGTIKLKAVSRLFGRTPHLQGRSARAERPVCRHISATLLTLHLPPPSFLFCFVLFCFSFINCSIFWIFSVSCFSCFPFRHCRKTRKATQHKSNMPQSNLN